MATSKTAKIEAEIGKVKAKISEYQSKLKELEGKKSAIENTEIVDMVRGMSISLDELATLLQSAKNPVTSGQLDQKLEPTPSYDSAEGIQ